jgi:hypothetical protein
VNKITNKAEFSAAFRADRQQDAIANQNKELAVALAKSGIPVFLCKSEDKTPLPIAWQRLDTTIPPEEREAMRRNYVDDKGFEPQHIGCTLDTELIRKWFRENKTALPAISCGPAGVYVVDNDKKFDDDGNLINDGVVLFDAFAEPHGGLPKGVFSLRTPRGGRHVYFDGTDTASLGCRRGSLTKDKYETDLKGTGGYVLAVSAIRATDGKSYGTKADLKTFLAAYKAKKLVPVPQFIRDAIGTKPEGASNSGASDSWESNSVLEREAQALAAELGITKLPDAGALLEPALGGFDMPKIEQRYTALREAIAKEDFSGIIFNLAGALKAERADVTAAEYAAVLFTRKDCGEFVGVKKATAGKSFNWRSVAKAWLRATPQLTEKSTGEAFGAPVDEEDDANVSPEVQALWDKQAAERADKAERLKSERESATSNSAELPFEFEHDVAANSTLPDWLVEDLIETNTLAVFYGPPNHGKSLLLLDMLYHVAAGKPWRGRDVKQGCVLFIAVEGPNGTARRAKAWRHHHGIADDVKLPMAFMRVGIDLYKSPKDAKRIVEAVERLEAATGLPCRAVAIDTISATTPGMDQNSEMGVFISRCRLILDGTKTASVIAVHHPGKNLAAGLRGDSNLIGAVDMTMLVNNGVAETEKMRDGVSGQTIPFRVTVEMLWENAKGKPVGAPVAIATSAGEAMGAVQDSDDAVTQDTYEAKLIGALNALETCVEFKANAVNEACEDIGVSSVTVLAQLNKDRKAARLPELKDRSIIPKLLAKLVASGKITKTGENKHTEYRLVY